MKTKYNKFIVSWDVYIEKLNSDVFKTQQLLLIISQTFRNSLVERKREREKERERDREREIKQRERLNDEKIE